MRNVEQQYMRDTIIIKKNHVGRIIEIDIESRILREWGMVMDDWCIAESARGIRCVAGFQSNYIGSKVGIEA